MQKELWVRTDVPEDKTKRKELLLSALEAGISTALIRSEDSDLAELGKINTYTISGGKISDGYEMVEIKTPQDQDYAFSLVDKCEGVILDASDWAVIPLENLIAKFRGSGTEVYAVAHDAENAETYLKTMENGTDGIVISVDDPSELSSFRTVVTSCGKEELVPLRVTSVKPIDLGDRVCIDTCSMMEPGEGMLIGSSSNCLFLIQSESEDNGYVAARPFRVNAGAVHSYILVPGGGTRYLSELAGGDPVLICGRDGTGRTASVGRCKVEIRPLLMVEATDGQSTYNVILQNAETIKMVTPDGSRSVTVLKDGDEVLAKVSSGGRHFGMAVEETITEK